MDKKVFYLAGVSFLVLSAVLMAGCVSQDADYIVGIDAEYPPYSFLDEKGNPTGFDIESMQWIADKKGIKVKFQPTAWDGIVPALQTGKIDIIYSGMSITDDRKEKVAFSNPYWKVGPAVAAKAGSDVTMDQFNAGEVTIGVQRGCSAVDWLEGHFGDNYTKMVGDKIKLYDSFTQSMVALENGLVQTTIFDDAGINQYIKGKDNLKLLGATDGVEDFAVAVRKDDTKLLALINEGLAELMASEKWEELKVKYELVSQ